MSGTRSNGSAFRVRGVAIYGSRMARRRGAVSTWSRSMKEASASMLPTRQAVTGVSGPPEGKDRSA
jgi:hypothetical protein